jgi:acyl transferase domain-containing protein
LSLKSVNAKVDMPQATSHEAIAIVGIGCRFPNAIGHKAFWNLLCTGGDAISSVPQDRFDIDAFYDPRPATPGKMVTRWGGFLQDVDSFDSSFFGISPREAAFIDPQHRLLLEVVWEAFEDAGEIPASLAGSQTGVFIGDTYNDYIDLQANNVNDLNLYSITGGSRSETSGRISYAFDLRGPGITIDSACSSSLLAVHLAAQSLQRGECRMALAGGVNLILQPDASICFSQGNMLSPDGRCKSFAADANGFVRSEGVGIVVLKPLSQALADGNPVYALVRGSAAVNEGRSSGSLGTPSIESQQQVLREAYLNAGVAPDQVHYVETHGTGTRAGDPVEFAALAGILGKHRALDNPCIIGSVKTNIGHTEGAAGIAGLIKAALCLKYRQIPPNLHFAVPNPDLPWSSSPLIVPQKLTPWSDNGEPAFAGVSSFGISGTNVHVVLEAEPRHTASAAEVSVAPSGAEGPYLLPLSAHSPATLATYLQAYQRFLAEPETDKTATLRDICYTAGARRTHHEHRLALVVRSRADAAEQLATYLMEEMSPAENGALPVSENKRKVVFVFPGQGSQWIGMGRRLMAEPIFLTALEQCERAMQPYVDWSLIEQLALDEDHTRLHELDCIQPTICAIQIALATLWRSWGVIPAAVVGHSMGEVAAAHVAGVLSLADAMKIICLRSKLARRVSGSGSMGVIGVSLPQASQILAAYADRLAVAASNSPTSTVISGDTAAMEEVFALLEKQNIFCRPVKVDFASHSPQVDGILDDLFHVLEGIRPQPATIPIYSTVTNTIGNGPEFDPTYWLHNLRMPVLFAPAIQQLLAHGHDIFIEISSHPILLSAIQQTLKDADLQGTLLASCRRDEDEAAVMLECLSTLYMQGLSATSIAWDRLYRKDARVTGLPPHPWQHEHHWFRSGSQGYASQQSGQRYGLDGLPAHPLLQRYLRSATQVGTYFWETALDSSANTLAYLNDHRVQDSIVFPATAYIEMVQAAAHEVFGARTPEIVEIAFHHALFIASDHIVQLQLVISSCQDNDMSFQFYTFSPDDTEKMVPPLLHAAGTIRLSSEEHTLYEALTLEHIIQRCTETMDHTTHYQRMARHGLIYGPAFQGVEHVWWNEHEALGRLHLTDELTGAMASYQMPPVLLDACFQVLAVPSGAIGSTTISAEDTYLPVAIRNFRMLEVPCGQAFWAYAQFRAADDSGHATDALEGNVFLLNEAGEVLAAIEGLRLQRLAAGQRSPEPQCMYTVQWDEAPRVAQGTANDHERPVQQKSWLILSDQDGVGTHVMALLTAQGDRCIQVQPGSTYQRITSTSYQVPPTSGTAFTQLWQDLSQDEHMFPQGIIHLWSLDMSDFEAMQSETLAEEQEQGCISALHLVQALLLQDGIQHSPQLFFVTRNAQTIDATADADSIPAPAQATLWGMGRSLSSEHPELGCVLIDLGRGDDAEIQMLCQELVHQEQGRQDQVALRGEQRYVAHFIPVPTPIDEQEREPETTDLPPRITVGYEHPFLLHTTAPGSLDALCFSETLRTEPGEGEVEIHVYAVGLNFHDVLLASGIDIGDDPEAPLAFGCECAGLITALGPGVDDFQIGDAVIAFVSPAIATYVHVATQQVMLKPTTLSFEEAATIPAAFLTTYYALCYLGHMSAGERVLIHSATGGVGMAALQLAQAVGAEIFATAGTAEKRAHLRSLGIQHVMDSRSLAFADEIMATTAGEGVDLVLNSLTGAAMEKSISVLAPFGRFLEIGKRDMAQNNRLGLRPFLNSLSFFSIDMNRMPADRPALLHKLWLDVMKLFKESQLQPLPATVFKANAVSDAFRHLARGRHMGKVVITLHSQEIDIVPLPVKSQLFMSDATYLITGGMGGLGLTIADWMIDRGARYLVLASRSGRNGASPQTQQMLTALGQRGAQVVISATDVTQEEQVSALLADIEQRMPPLRGIFHAAAILDDSTVMQLDQQRFLAVMAPKVLGAWHLHHLTRDIPVDYFVLFSSIAGLLGSPGQSNYSAGNTFLDALAHARHASGLPALSINWGPWAEVGLAASQDNRGRRLSNRGLSSLSPAQGLSALEHLLTHTLPQVAVSPFDVMQWCQFYSSARQSSFLTRLLEEANRHQTPAELHAGPSPTQASQILTSILDAVGDERIELIESYLKKKTAHVLGFTQPNFSLNQPLNRLGIDSLMAVELRDAIHRDAGVLLPFTVFLKGATVKQLAQQIFEQLLATPSLTAATPAELQSNDEQAGIEQFSDQEVDVLLKDLLANGAISETLLQSIPDREETQK